VILLFAADVVFVDVVFVVEKKYDVGEMIFDGCCWMIPYNHHFPYFHGLTMDFWNSPSNPLWLSACRLLRQ